MTGPLPRCEFAGPGPLRDKLVAAVLAGAKTSTSSLAAQYQDEPLPGVGRQFGVVDSHEAVVAVIEVTAVEILKMADIDLQFAIDEGEGFESVADWRRAHEDFWRSDPEVRSLGIELSDDTLVVAERFRLVD